MTLQVVIESVELFELIESVKLIEFIELIELLEDLRETDETKMHAVVANDRGVFALVQIMLRQSQITDERELLAFADLDHVDSTGLSDVPEFQFVVVGGHQNVRLHDHHLMAE